MHSDARSMAAMIQGLFAEEIASRGGTVSDVFAQGSRLILRSVLPKIKEVGRKDKIQGGVALRANERELWVHPYVFRQVCSNGAVWAQAMQSEYISDLDVRSPEEVAPQLREAIRCCAAEKAFTQAAGQMRAARGISVSGAASLLAVMHSVPPNTVALVMQMFFAANDRTAFGLGNAITATARETTDEDLRWRLEELGGGVFAISNACPPHLSSGKRREPERADTAERGRRTRRPRAIAEPVA